MHAVQNKQNLVYLNTQIKFRDQQTALTGISGGNKVFMTTLANPYLNYEERTVPLDSDTTYAMQIISVDNLKNESVAVQGNVTIPEFVLFPRFLNSTYLPMYEDNTYARGDQLLTNPDFDTDSSGWTGLVSNDVMVVNGVVQLTLSTAGTYSFRQAYNTTEGGWYNVEYSVLKADSSANFVVINQGGGTPRPIEPIPLEVGVREYSFYYDPSIGNGNGFEVYFQFNGGSVGEQIFLDYARLYQLHKNVTPVRLSWTVPVDGEPDEYHVYSNNGSGEIDENHVYTIVAGTETSVDLLLNDNLNWLLKVEAVRNNIESSTKFAVEVQTPSTAVPPPSPFEVQNTVDVVVDPETGETINSSGNSPDDETGETVVTGTEPQEVTQQVPASFSGVSATNVNAGKLKVQFIWIYGDLASKFRIYHDNGTGTVDYTNPIEFDRINSIVQSYTTDQIYNGFDDKEFRFVIRSVSQFNVEDTNTVEHRVLLDGQPPEEVENLTINTDI